VLLELKYDVKTRQNCKYGKEVKREMLEYARDVSPQPNKIRKTNPPIIIATEDNQLNGHDAKTMLPASRKVTSSRDRDIIT